MSLVSLKLVDAIFEDNLTAFVNHTVTYAGKSKATSDYRAHIDQELEKVFTFVRVLHSEGGHLVIENNQTFIRLELCLAR